MLLRWWKSRRRRKLAREPFPPEWEAIIRRNLRQVPLLSGSEFARLKRDVRWFLDEKELEGCGGLTLTTEIEVTIAAHVAYVGLGFPEPPFDAVVTVLVYPDLFVANRKQATAWGGIEEGNQALLGEAWQRGPVVLSWHPIEETARGESDGRNLVAHEFAHVLDGTNGLVDGIPALDRDLTVERWRRVIDAEYQRLVRMYRLNQPTLFDPYGTTNLVEFFAVASESFFELPVEFSSYHPELYELFVKVYHQDPAARERRAAAG